MNMYYYMVEKQHITSSKQSETTSSRKTQAYFPPFLSALFLDLCNSVHSVVIRGRQGDNTLAWVMTVGDIIVSVFHR